MFQFNHRKTRVAIVAGIAAIGLAQISVNLSAQSSSEDVRLTYPAAAAPVQATVNAYGDSIDFDFNLYADFAVVRISGPDFYTISKRIENADYVTVDLLRDLDFSAYADNEIEAKALADAVSLPDGRYTFEIMVHSSEGFRHTTRGRFEVFGGNASLLPPKTPAPNSDEELSAVREPGLMQRLAGSLLEFIVPSAHAQSSFVDDFLTIDDDAQDNDTGLNLLQDGSFTEFGIRNDTGVLKIKDSPGAVQPSDTVFLNIVGSTGKVGFGTETPQTTLHLVTPNAFAGFRLEDTRNTWQISTGGTSSDLGFRIQDISGGTSPLKIESGAPTDSIRVAANGNVGIGTDPARNLHIKTNNINVRQRWDNSASEYWEFWHGGSAIFWQHFDGSATRTPVKFNDSAPNNSLVVASAGIGVGTSSPEAIVDVRRSDGSSGSSSSVQLSVENTTGVTANRDMMRLTNNGGVQFKMDTGGAVWNFAGLDNSFVINDVSVAGVPLRVFSNGNMTINGTLTESSSRAVKHDIQPLDSIDVLQKLTSLEISRWRYDSNPGAAHVGPIAEDWYEVFGLGDDNQSVAPRDLAGVALAAAKALREENLDLRARLDDLEGKIRDTF